MKRILGKILIFITHKFTKEKMFKDENLLKWEGVFFNIFCVLYFLSLGPFVSNAVLKALNDREPMPVLAIFLLLLMFAETFALNKKLWQIQLGLDKIPKKSNVIIFVLWLLHFFSCLLMLYVFLLLAGFEHGESPQMKKFIENSALAIVIKEIWLLIRLPFKCNINEYLRKGLKPKLTKFWGYDIILLLFACFGYSAIIDTMLAHPSLDKEHMLTQFFSFLRLFTLLYLPFRLAYIYEEIISTKSIKDVLRIFLSYIILLLCVYISKFIYPLLF